MLQREFQTKVIGTHFAGLGYPIYEFEYSERKIGMYLSMQGGPATSVFMEETISRGASTFLFFGFCGALNSSLTQGKLIVPSKTFRDEGTSGHYMEKGDWVDITTCPRLSSIFEELNVPFVTGPVWTTDAPYRETPGMTNRMKSLGCIGVDMECASIMAVSQFRKIESYQFLFTEDRLDGPSWDKGTMGHMGSSMQQILMKVALETAAQL
jgi:uridine phosphorylase